MSGTGTQERIKELQGALRLVLDDIDEGIDKGVKIDGANVEVKQDDADWIQSKMAEAKSIENLILAGTYGTETKAFDRSPAGASVNLGQDLESAFGTVGEAFIASNEFKALQSSRKMTMDEAFEMNVMDLTSMGRKDVFTGSVPGTTSLGFGRTQRDPMVPVQRRTFRVRDLFPVVGTNANLIDFFRVLGFSGGNTLSGAAGSVRERAAGADGVSAPLGDATDVFGLKPRSALTFEAAQAPVRTLAHYEVAHRNVLADEPQLQGTINNELMYGLAIEEDRQILLGSGANEQLLGILNTTGIQSYTQAAGPEPKSDALRRSATKATLANFPSTGFVLHPNDWEDIELQKATGDGQYMLFSNISVGAATQVWRQPVVETAAMPEGTWLTGAFGLAAQLYDRQQANIRIAEQHADFFVRNAIVILAEQRLALAVKRPQAFVKGTFI